MAMPRRQSCRNLSPALNTFLVSHRFYRRNGVLHLRDPLQGAVRRHRVVLGCLHDEIALAAFETVWGGRRACLWRPCSEAYLPQQHGTHQKLQCVWCEYPRMVGLRWACCRQRVALNGPRGEGHPSSASKPRSSTVKYGSGTVKSTVEAGVLHQPIIGGARS